ncbi:MAG: LamG-like jellyroll fold domain-containing protein [Candidatus Ornithomonoglobus sp.]
MQIRTHKRGFGYTRHNGILSARYTENDYVRSGIICRLDGINNTGAGHASSASVWTDLSGNGNSFMLNGCTWNNSNLHFEKGCYAIGTRMNPTAITIEITAKIEVWQPNVFLIDNLNSGGAGIQIIKDSSLSHGLYFSIHDGSSYLNYNSRLSFEQMFTVALSYNSDAFICYANAGQIAVLPGGALKAPSNNTVWALGANPKGSVSEGSDYENLVGNIYSVRIYNRSLSPEELRHNHMVDTLRFKNGII